MTSAISTRSQPAASSAGGGCRDVASSRRPGRAPAPRRRTRRRSGPAPPAARPGSASAIGRSASEAKEIGVGQPVGEQLQLARPRVGQRQRHAQPDGEQPHQDQHDHQQPGAQLRRPLGQAHRLGQAEPVADAAHGLHQLRRGPSLVRRVATCTSSVRLAPGPGPAPDLGHDPAAGAHRAARAGQQREHLELLAGQRHRPAGDGHRVPVQVDRHLVEHDHVRPRPSGREPDRRRRYTACTRATSSPMS